RIMRYPIAETNSSGRVTNVRRRTNEEMREFGFSLEQYEGLQRLIETSYIEADGLQPKSMHDFIRLRMKSVDTIAPLHFMEQYAEGLVTVFELREEFVQGAWADFKANGPVVYPEERHNENIFQAYGRW